MRFSNVVFVVVLGVLAVFGCSSEPSPEQGVGTLGLALVAEDGGVAYRLIGTILVRSRRTGAIEATVNAEADGPSTQSVSLAPGGYTLEVADGYSCTVEPVNDSFTGCTYSGFAPDPFVIAGAQTSEVSLNFSFHFEDDLGVVFRTGDATIALVPDARPCADGCADGELCVAFDGGEPVCALECTTDDDCGVQQACFAVGDGETRVCSSLVTRLWSTPIRTGLDDAVEDIAVDGDGSLFVTGGTLGEFPGQTSSGARDGFVRKLDGNGNEMWTTQFELRTGSPRGAELARTTFVALDGSGNVVVGGSLDDYPGDDGFVRKLDSDGNEIWTMLIPGKSVGWVNVRALAADGRGDIFVGGKTSGLPGQVDHGRLDDAFIRKLDGDGNEIWTRQFVGTVVDSSYYKNSVDSIAVDELGNIFIAGSVDVDGSSVASFSTAYVQQLDPDGTVLWTWQHGSDLAFSTSVATDGIGGVLVAGYSLGSGVITQPGLAKWDAFVTKLDGDGNALWTQQFRSSVDNKGLSVASDGVGNVFVAVSAGTDFVTKLNAEGDVVWTEPLESTSLAAVCVNLDGNAFAAGVQSTSNRGDDVVVVKLGL